MCSANIFSDINQNHVYWKICKVSKVFSFCWGSIIFAILSESKFGKWVKGFFWVKLYCKMSDLFRQFLLNSRMLENLELKDKLQIWSFELFIFGSKFRFLRLFLGRFSQCNFEIFRRRSTMVTDIFAQIYFEQVNAGWVYSFPEKSRDSACGPTSRGSLSGLS